MSVPLTWPVNLEIRGLQGGGGEGGGGEGVAGFFNFQAKSPGKEVDGLCMPFLHTLQTTRSNQFYDTGVSDACFE